MVAPAAFREALQPLTPVDDDDSSGEGAGDDLALGFRQLDDLLVGLLSWDAQAIERDAGLLQTWTRELPELGETLSPTALVAGFQGDGKPQLLIQELVLAPGGEPLELDRRQQNDGGWRASPQERFERM